MAAAIASIGWSSYRDGPDGRGFFNGDPLLFSSRQERLHRLAPGDRLLLLSRATDDAQYYFVCLLSVARLVSHAPGSAVGDRYGAYGIVAERSLSCDFGKRFPAEGLARAFSFDTNRAVAYGASLGQSLQTIRWLGSMDECVFDAALRAVTGGEPLLPEAPFGLWTKCDLTYANYFVANWQDRQTPIAFMLFDTPPVLLRGAPVFVHSDKNLRLVARFEGSEYVAGHKQTVSEHERREERERVWSCHRAGTLGAPTKDEFDAFWERENGVRSLFFISDVSTVSERLPFSTYGRALQWGYPLSVGHRYLNLSQCVLLLKACQLSEESAARYLAALI